MTNFRTMLNEISAPIFVVDEDAGIRDFNDAAESTFALWGCSVLNRRCGEVLHCIHAADAPEGCGSGQSCLSCVIRRSVTESLGGRRVVRRRTSVTPESRQDTDVFVTANALGSGEEPLALLILENVGEVSPLQDIMKLLLLYAENPPGTAHSEGSMARRPESTRHLYAAAGLAQ